MGELSFDEVIQRMERTRRANQEPVRARPQSVRVQFGDGRGDRGQPCGDRRGHRDRRIHRLPVVGERTGRHQADGRPGEPLGNHPDLAFAGHGRPDGAGPSRMPRCCSRRWSGVDERDAATKASAGKSGDYSKGLDAGALKGARIGVARKRYFGYSPAADRVIDAAIARDAKGWGSHCRSRRHSNGVDARRLRVGHPAV